MFKNWKSTFAFMVFIAVYVYTVYNGSGDNVIEVAGYIALYSSVFMMLRSEMTTSIVEKLVDNLNIGRK